MLGRRFLAGQCRAWRTCGTGDQPWTSGTRTSNTSSMRRRCSAWPTTCRGWERPCCLCAPLLGQYLARRGVAVCILDIDDRFAATPGFRRYDIYRPEWLDERFDLIVCDPPFFKVSLSQLFAAIRLLSHHDHAQPLLISYLKRRSSAVLGTFAPFGLAPTGFCPTYLTVEETPRTATEFFSNIAPQRLASLGSGG
jgi:Probable N6-adenine methyltransferase